VVGQTWGFSTCVDLAWQATKDKSKANLKAIVEKWDDSSTLGYDMHVAMKKEMERIEGKKWES
jgi:hypothetical protein